MVSTGTSTEWKRRDVGPKLIWLQFRYPGTVLSIQEEGRALAARPGSASLEG